MNCSTLVVFPVEKFQFGLFESQGPPLSPLPPTPPPPLIHDPFCHSRVAILNRTTYIIYVTRIDDYMTGKITTYP